MEVLRCGHCSFQTKKIRRLENHLKAKHTTTTKDSDSDADFIDLEEELFSEMEFDLKPNLSESPEVESRRKVGAAAAMTETSSRAVSPAPMSTDTQDLLNSNPNTPAAAFKCNICDFSAVSRRMIGVHTFKNHRFQKASDVKNFDLRCPLCPFVGKSSMSLKIHQHRKGHHPNPENPGSEVAQTPVSHASDDQAEAASDEDLKCPNCHFVGSSQSSLKNHVYKRRCTKELDSLPAEFLCPECGFVGSNRKSLATHICRVHKANAAAIFKMMAKNEKEIFIKSRHEIFRPKIAKQLPTLTPTPTPPPVMPVKTEAIGDSIGCETKSVLMKAESSEAADILKDFIRCPACQFMCNSLRSMGEHVAAVHAASAKVRPEAVAAAIQVGATIGNVNIDDTTTNRAESSEMKRAGINKKFPCSKCDAVFTRVDSLRKHCKVRHDGQGDQRQRPLIKGPRQLVKTETGSAVRTISRKSRVHGSIPCHVCKVFFFSNSNLKRHSERFHPTSIDAAVGANPGDAFDVEIIDG